MRVRGNRCAGWRRAASLSPSSVFLLCCKTTRPSSRGSSCSAAPTWPWDEMPSGSGWRREVNQDFPWWSCSSACTDCPYFVKCRRSNVCVFLCSSFFLCGVSEPRSDICTCLIETCRYCCYCTVILHRNLLHIILITKHFIFFIHEKHLHMFHLMTCCIAVWLLPVRFYGFQNSALQISIVSTTCWVI